MQFDIIVRQAGIHTTLTALVSSPVACHLLEGVTLGTMRSGTRYLLEHECDAVFALIDDANLTTRTLG